MQQQSAAEGRRLVDVLTAHYYPQGGELSNDTAAGMHASRNKSTRSLWDPTYVDTSWIGSVIRYIPQLHDWVNQYYPGTLIGITEYNWGAESHINGASTEAELLGVSGGGAGDLRPRVIGDGRALDDSRHGHADLQGHQDLPELRRAALRLRRHE